MDKTIAELQEDLEREKVFSRLSNKKILELLAKQKEVQEDCEAKIQAIQDQHQKELSFLKSSVTQAAVGTLSTKESEYQNQLLFLTSQYEEKLIALKKDHKAELETQEERLNDKLLAQESYYKEKLYQLEQASKPVRNQRGAGRKRVATPETIEMVLKLRETGVSYVKISEVLKERLGVELGRTTVGEIVRGNYTAKDKGAETL